MGKGELLMVARNLIKSYGSGQGAVSALADVSLQLRVGEFLTILGSSGSGKSTLLHLMGGMDRPTSGTIRFMGEDIAAYSQRQLAFYRRRQVGFVFQQYNLLADLTALENVRIAASLAGSSMKAETALSLVGLSNRCNAYPGQLSGGEQQRVSIARALVKQPQLLLCDEPTGALDYASGKQILAVLERLNRSLGCTIVLVTHTQAIGLMADRVLRMRSGQIIREYKNTVIASASEVEW